MDLLEILSMPEWEGFPELSINVPPLTMKEAAALQSILPSDSELTIQQVEDLGFSLEPSKITAFQNYYRYYPTLAEVVL